MTETLTDLAEMLEEDRREYERPISNVKGWWLYMVDGRYIYVNPENPDYIGVKRFDRPKEGIRRSPLIDPV
jgi:hypothetical protein